MLDQALQYADLGYAVFPCAPGAKHPLTQNGLKDATTDWNQIETWWIKWPDANIAVRTDGLVVIDFDSIDGRANPWLQDDPDRCLDLAIAPMSQTPRGGRHYWFRCPAGRSIGNSASRIAPKVDVRGNGGYVLVAPSSVAGKSYSWPIGELDCAPEKLPEPPEWLLELLDAKAATGPRTEKTQPANKIAEGHRNDALFRLGCMMRRGGMAREEIAAALHKANIHRCEPSLSASEVDTIVGSCLKYEADARTVERLETAGPIALAAEEEEPEPTIDPGPVPGRLLYVPGFIADVMAHTLETAPYPQPVLAFGGALALQAFLASRKVRDRGDARPSLYLLGLANSGAGKDHPRKITQRILHEVGLGDSIAAKPASYEGLEDLLFIRPALLLQIDEVDALLQAARKSFDARHELIVKAFTEIFTHANAIYHLRTKASQDRPRSINQPGLNIFGTAIPSQVYASMTPAMLIDGFFSRLIILEAGQRGVGQEAIAKELPESVLRVAKWWKEFSLGGTNFNEINPTPRVIEQTTEAAELLAAYRRDADALYSEAEGRDDQVAMAMWSRANEKCRRLAINYACSENCVHPLITAEAATWAAEFATHQSRRMLFMASSHVVESDFDARCQKMLRVLRTWRERHGDAWMPDRQLKRKLQSWTPREHDDVRTSLEGQGRIEREPIEHLGAGRPTLGYRLRGL